MAGSFLDMQAQVGITVHVGGLGERRRLLRACDAGDAREILEVGCGIGVGPVHTARTCGCRVVAIDRSERMIEWSRRRARVEGVADRIELRVADVLALPFEDDRFDATICESVLAFVGDKQQAIREMVRVTRPGGHVGLSEMFLLSETPSPQVVALGRLQATEMVSLAAWNALWDASGLRERVVLAYRIDFAREVRNRLRWIGLRGLLGGLARIVRLYLAEPSLRPALGLMFGRFPGAQGAEPAAPSAWASFGYGLFVGRKQLGPNGARERAASRLA
jgi:SAM-dependent methyltransferase